MKRVLVRIHHSTHPPYRLQLRPGTKVSDVLVYLNLPDEAYVIYQVSDPRKQYTSMEVLYDLIASDVKLIATLSPEAVRTYATAFLP